MADPFSPQSIAAAVQSTLNAPDVVIPDGKSHAIVTSYDGKDVRAVYAFRLNKTWSVAGNVDWHGVEPQLGVQVHASW